MHGWNVRLIALMTLLVLLAACGGAPQTGDTSAPAASEAGTTASTAPAPSEAPASEAASEAASTASAAPEGTSDASSTGTGSALAGSDQCTAEAASAPAPEPPILVIGTGNTGGVFFPYGGGIARVLTEQLGEGAQVTAEETGGSVDNMKLVQNGDADIGLSTVDSAYDAVLGQGAYTDTGPIPACALAVLYTSFVHVVALQSSGINTVEDMRGKTVSVGSAGSSTEGAADRVLEAAGLDPQADVTRENLSVSDSVAAMKDQKIDAFFWIGGLPTSAVTDLVNTQGVSVTFVPTAQYVPALREKYGPVYTEFAILAGTYAGFDEEIPGTGIGNLLFVNANMNEELAYNIVKNMFDNLASVQESHPEARSLALETAAQDSSIAFHPGAVRYYTEQGVFNQ